MSRLTDFAVIGVAGLMAAGASALLVRDGVAAADHLDPPSRTDFRFDPTTDPAADIADIYAWTTPSHLNMVYTFAGPGDATNPATYDPNVRYRIHLSTAGRVDDDEHTILAQFGQGSGGFGIKWEGLPGVAGPVIAPVERIVILPNGIKLFSGLRADPFFFDVLGFRATNSSGTLSILNTRDFFVRANDTLIAVQVPIGLVGRDTNGDGRADNRLDVWVDAYRKGGQL